MPKNASSIATANPITDLLSANVGFCNLFFLLMFASTPLYGELRVLWLKRSSPECTLFHEREEDRNENENVNG